MTGESQSQSEWVKPVKAHLYHGQDLVGIITNIAAEDMFQWSGNIELMGSASVYKPMFDYFNNESRQREPDEPDEEDLPFDESLMNNWFIEDENGRRAVSYPVVSVEGEVFWRD